MIDIEIGGDKGKLFYLAAAGHARTSTDGSPEVCAAVTALCFAVAEWATNHFPKKRVIQEDDDGLFVLAVDTSGLTTSCEQAWEVVKTGFQQLAENYPQFVHML